MNIHEYQAKELFRKFGIPVPEGHVASNPMDAEKFARELLKSNAKVVVKAQIHAGGRGKGTVTSNEAVPGVKVVSTAEEAFDHAKGLLGQTLVTNQTGPEGRMVKKVYIEQASAIEKELYAGILLDRETGRITFIASVAGGMDIEAVAHDTPGKIFRQAIDPNISMMPFYGRKLAQGLGLSGELEKQATAIFTKLYQLFLETDASLIEINPFVITKEQKLIALDGKINFDDNALFRHSDIATLRDINEEDAKEQVARDAGLSYVALSGNIGCLVNGAGLAMATMDIIQYAGGKPANFLDVGGGATAEQVTQAFKIILADPNVKAILVNIFGGIAKCDVIATGIIKAAKDVGIKVPLVVRLEGTNVDLGKKMLRESGLAITPANDMRDAAEKVVSAAGVGR